MRDIHIAALSVSMSALVALAIVRGASTPVQPSTPEQALLPLESEAPGSIAARLSELESRLEASEEGGPVLDPLVRPRIELSGRADLELRLTQLESTVAELVQLTAAKGPWKSAMAAAMDTPHHSAAGKTNGPDAHASRSEINRVLMDPFASEGEKVAAHKSLRRVDDAYELGAVQALLTMAQLSNDPDVRADVWMNFDGTTHVPEIVPHLVQAIRSESNDAVRIEAVETLGNYLEDPQNRTLIQEIARDDPVKAVRDRARRALSEHPALDD